MGDTSELTAKERALLRAFSPERDVWESLPYLPLCRLQDKGLIAGLGDDRPQLTETGVATLRGLRPVMPKHVFERAPGIRRVRCVICDQVIRDNALGRAAHTRSRTHQANQLKFESTS